MRWLGGAARLGRMHGCGRLDKMRPVQIAFETSSTARREEKGSARQTTRRLLANFQDLTPLGCRMALEFVIIPGSMTKKIDHMHIRIRLMRSRADFTLKCL
jgi:hypothetical protein